MRDVRKKLTVASADRFPIVAMHVRRVEEVAVATPNFIEDLGPFFGGYAFRHEARGGDSFLRGGASGRGIVDAEALGLANEHSRAVPRKNKAIQVVDESHVFTVFEGVEVEVGLGAGLAAIVRSRGNSKHERAGFCGKAEVVVGIQRNPGGALVESIEVNALVPWDLGLLFGRRVGLLVSIFLGVVILLVAEGHFIALGREWIFDILAKSKDEDAAGAVSGEVEFDLRDLGLEFMVGEIVEIISIRIPDRGILVESTAGYPA